MPQGFCSNILFKQPFKTADDITVSFLIQDPGGNIDSGILLLQTGDRLLLQDESFFRLNFELIYDGFGVFLIDSRVNTLTGGGAGAGLGLITDTTTAPTSALSGFFLGAVFDLDGVFSAANIINQFNTGTPTPVLSSLCVRKLSSFEYVGSKQVETLTKPFNDEWNVFRVAFKNNMQQVVFYQYSEGVYTQLYTVDTNINLSLIPPGARIGVTWSGNFPIKIKNVTLNGSIDN